MAIILTERATALSVTKVYQERLKKSAELVAKKELVSLSTAIDSAAVKGLDRVDFKLSTAVTKLVEPYHTIAINIIEDDIRAAGYDANRVFTKDAITSYEVSWAEQEEVPVEPDPVNPGGGDTPTDDPTDDDEDPTDIQSPEDLSVLITEQDEVEATLSNDLVFTAPIAITAGKKATIHVDSNIENNAQTAFLVDGGELVIDGEGEISGAGRAIIAQNGGRVTINGGKYISTSAGQTIAAIGSAEMDNGLGETYIQSSTINIHDAEVEAQEAAVMAFDGGAININGGTFTTKDNFVIGTNGTAGRGDNLIHVSNAILNGGIESNGYEACGIYVANNDTVYVQDSIINVENGCGILMRGGHVSVSNTQITTTGTEGGWVGDKKKVMSNSGIIYDEASNYPGKEGMSLVCGPDVTFNCSGETVEVLSNEETPNVTIVA